MMKGLFLGSVALVALATGASAQDYVSSTAMPASGTTVAQPPAPAAEAPEAGVTDRAGIGDIIVTASRRAENVQRAALSVQAISSEALVRANVIKPEDLTKVAVGVQIANAGPLTQVYIRGVGNFNTQATAESAVAFNLDGVYISRAWATRGMFYDLERVEALKGPQGTLYGRNASGGAVNVITAKPKIGEFSGFVEGQIGNYDMRQGSAAINLPVSNTLAIRASGQFVDRKGYLSDGLEDDVEQSGRLQALWKPNDDVSLLLSGHYQHIGGRGTGAILFPQLPGDKFRSSSDPAVTAIFLAEPGLGPLLTYPHDDNFMNATIYAITGELNVNLGAATLTVLPAYRDSTLRDRNYNAGFEIENYEHNKQTSVEVRIGANTNKLKWVVGGFFFDERSSNLPGLPILAVYQGVNTQLTPSLAFQTRSYAAFGQATYGVTDRLRLTGGIRYTHERKTNVEFTQVFGLPNQRTDIPLNLEVSFNNVTYKAGVEFDVAPRSLAYANVSTGFKSGGFYDSPPPNTFRPEKLTSFEIGSKNRFFDNRLQVNLEAFYWIYKDHQESFVGPTSIPNYFTFITVNAGKAKSYGVDLDVLFRATLNDELSLKVQYNKTRYDSFSYPSASAIFGPPATSCSVGPLQSGTQIVDCSGKALVRAPLWSGTVGYSHTFPLGSAGDLRAAFNMQFSSAYFLSTEFLEAARQKAYTIGDANLEYTTKDRRFTLSFFVNNIWNSLVGTQAFRYPFISAANPIANPDGAFFATVRPPRTFGARARFNF